MDVLPSRGTTTRGERDNGNTLKFSTGKWQVLQLGKNNYVHHCGLGADQLEGNLAEKILLDTEFTTSSNVLLQQRRPTVYWDVLDHCQHVDGGGRSSLHRPHLRSCVPQSRRGVGILEQVQ